MFIHKVALTKMRTEKGYGIKIGDTTVTMLDNSSGRVVLIIDSEETIEVIGEDTAPSAA